MNAGGDTIGDGERVARVTSTRSSLADIENYLPSNYRAVEHGGSIYIVGRDTLGWTLDDYVLPRLASGLHAAEEVSAVGDDTPP